MPRPRKKHVQQDLPFPKRGGKRPGAGRPRKGYRSSERHKQRLRFNKLSVIHVTLRLVERFGDLRQEDTFRALRAATRAVLDRADFRIVHISPEVDHVHLIVEADSDGALASGVQAFEISAAQRLNRAISKRYGKRRRGQVFADRYHARLVKSPTQALHTINYVLNNWRRHDQDEASLEARFWDVDYFSSAVSFTGWKELEHRDFKFPPAPDGRLCVSPPQTWLLSTGWQKAGAISMYAVPGSR